MAGFGERLKRERESRDTPLEDVARRTRIGIQYLEALERGDFDGLPGRRGFGKFYIRLYAELFGFDPGPVISAYDQERVELERPDGAGMRVRPERPRRVRFVPRPRKPAPVEEAASAEPPEPDDEEPVPDAVVSPVEAIEPVMPPAPVMLSAPPPIVASQMTNRFSSWTRRFAGAAAALAILGAFAVIAKTLTSPSVNPPAAEPPASTEPATPSPAPPAKPIAPVPAKPAPVTTTRAATPPPPARPRPVAVDDFELGDGVADYHVIDVRREFEEGMVASFLTRVRGGAPGQTIHHVWIHEGRVIQRIALRLGGPDWRTYSRKTLWGAGDWAVEAQDGDHRVLARVAFHCLPAGGPRSGG